MVYFHYLWKLVRNARRQTVDMSQNFPAKLILWWIVNQRVGRILENIIVMLAALALPNAVPRCYT